MTQEPKHFELPCRILGVDECPEGIPVIEICSGEFGETFEQIAYIQPEMIHDDFVITERTKANAAFIVHAINNHHKLIAALEIMVGWALTETGGYRCRTWLEKAEKALAEARGVK